MNKNRYAKQQESALWHSAPDSSPSCSAFIQLPANEPGQQQVTDQVLGPRYPCGRSSWNSEFLMSAWPIPSWCGHPGSELVGGRSHTSPSDALPLKYMAWRTKQTSAMLESHMGAGLSTQLLLVQHSSLLIAWKSGRGCPNCVSCCHPCERFG